MSGKFNKGYNYMSVAGGPHTPVDHADDIFNSESVARDPLAFVVHAKSYSRALPGGRRETYDETIKRVLEYIVALGKLSDTERREVSMNMKRGVVFSSGRSMWVGGTGWSTDPENYPGLYNCSSTEIRDLRSFGMIMDLSMMGCGTGAVLESDVIGRLPTVKRRLTICQIIQISDREHGRHNTILCKSGPVSFIIRVGDSRAGWVSAFMAVLNLACGVLHEDSPPYNDLHLEIDLSEVRRAGSSLKGFGGVANPCRLPSFFVKIVSILSNAKGRNLSVREVTNILDEISLVVVAGNIRRSAGLRQYDFEDPVLSNLKKDLYHREGSNLVIDRERDGMQLAAHTRVIHRIPSIGEITCSVRAQFESGEGALEFAPEAIARGNADLFPSRAEKEHFIHSYAPSDSSTQSLFVQNGVYDPVELYHRLHRYGLNPCGEIIGHEFLCNLSEVHLNRLDPNDYAGQFSAFYSAGIVAASFLVQRFSDDRHQLSRELDPIVGVSFTGLWDFLVKALGKRWIDWMMQGRPSDNYLEGVERKFLGSWREAAWCGVTNFCRRRDIQLPSRVTTVQPAGTKSMLTGASAGWHAPKSLCYIRRIVLPARDPIALACMDCGYDVLPALRDSHECLVLDKWDPSCTEWIVEIPCRVPWVGVIRGADLRLEELPAVSQFGLYMTVQKFYTDHNTSGSIEVCENEIGIIAESIQREIGHGYLSVSLSARLKDDAMYPQMPIQPITPSQYEDIVAAISNRRKSCSLDSSFQYWVSAVGVDGRCPLPSTCGCSD